MFPVVILHRVVTHYRLPLFRRLFQEFGWVVACARNPPSGTFLNFEHDAPFLLPFDFTFPNAKNQYRANVPVGEILRHTGAKAILAEFSMYMTSSYELLFRRRLRGGPATVFWSHGYNMERGRTTIKGRLSQVPRVALLGLADGNICYSEEGKRFLDDHMDPARVFVVHNTIDVSAMEATASRLDQIVSRGHPSLLSIGRMAPDKNFPRLVRIFRRFRERYPGAILTIVGDGPDRQRVCEAAGDELGGAIQLVGAEYEEERLARLFRSADLVVFPGAVGLSVNHALAYGVPVMAYDRTHAGPHHHPEIAYVVDEVTGCRVPQYTEDAMFSALCEFFARHSDPKASFGDSIAGYVAENLTLDVMIEDFRRVRRFLHSLGVDGA